MILGDSAQKSLLIWYQRNRRKMPWREDPTPYHVYVSEIMLQQTRVDTAEPYYLRFIEELPDVSDLAACPEEKLLKLWEGLGYYSRVRNMKRAMEICVREHGGRIPGEREALLKLPGIGSYTAGAVLSIAFHKPEPVADGNVLRVISRISGSTRDIADPKTRLYTEDSLREVLQVFAREGGDPGTLNQALMELGALVCLPNGAPKCADCPWKELCEAHLQDLTDEIPVKSPKKARETVAKSVFVVRRGERVALLRNGRKGLLSGLYGLPEMPAKLSQTEAEALFGGTGAEIRPLPDGKHIFTHREWHMKAYLVRLPEDAVTPEFLRDAVFATEEETRARYPVAAAYKKWNLFSGSQDP